MSDRISNLPDELLLHILSSKSLKFGHAAATSLLSKRWRSLWLSIPKLEFDDSRFYCDEFFLQYIHTTLNVVDLKSVRMFVLKSLYRKVPDGKVKLWVNKMLIKSKLEYLMLWFPPNSDLRVRVPLPSSIFNCSSIRILKLARGAVSNLSTVNLPSLKTLHLTEVKFSNAECLSVLLSKCVGLEELLLMHVELPYKDYRTLDIGRLPHLVIARVPVDLFSVIAFPNVTFLSLNEGSFAQHDFFPRDCDIPEFYNLTHLEIRHLNQKQWTKLVSCLRSVPNLETLIIYQSHIGSVNWSVEASVDVPACISSHLKTFYLDGFRYFKSEFEIVRFIMKNAKLLRSVIVRPHNYYSLQEAERLSLLQILSSYTKCSESCSVFVDAPTGNLFENVYSKLRSEKDFSYFIKA